MTMQPSFTERVIQLENAYWADRKLGKVWSGADLRAKAVLWWGLPLGMADSLASKAMAFIAGSVSL